MTTVNKNNFLAKKKRVENGVSELFNSWALAHINKEEFLENLEWVCQDSLDENGNLTRAMVLMADHFGEPDENGIEEMYGKIIKVDRSSGNDPRFWKVWGTKDTPVHNLEAHLSCRDRI